MNATDASKAGATKGDVSGLGGHVNLATFMRDKRAEEGVVEQAGPFVTISRQYGCTGYLLGTLLVDLLNRPGSPVSWKVYHREILHRLATETNIAAERLERLRRERPSMLTEFVRNFSSRPLPGGYEIRNRIGNIIRGLAFEGHSIIIGMGGAGATVGIDNGLRIGLSAPLEWRVGRVAEHEGISPVEARVALTRRDREWDDLRKIYMMRCPRSPVFDLNYDCSRFTLTETARHIVCAMRMKAMTH